MGTLVWLMHRRLCLQMNYKQSYVSSQYTPTGYQTADVDVVICVLVLTLFYALVRACFFLYA